MPRSPYHPGYQRLRSGRRSEPGRAYFITTVARGREPLFADFEPAARMSSLIASPSTWPASQLLAWVLMPDHWHGLLAIDGSLPLSTIIQRAKGRSAHGFNLFFQRRGSVWRDGYHDRALRSDDDFRAAARYLIANPLRAGLVKSVSDYPFWDAVWMDASMSSLVPD